MKIPKRYQDLTAYQLQQLELVKADLDISSVDRQCKRLSILTGKPIEYIESLTPTIVYEHLLSCLYLANEIEDMKCPKYFRLGFKYFKRIEDLGTIPFSLQKDFEQILKDNDNNYKKCLPELMALSHLELTVTGWRYVQKNHYKNVEIFKKSKLKKSLGGVFFYSKSLSTYANLIKDYSVNLLNQTATMIHEEIADLAKRGDGSIV